MYYPAPTKAIRRQIQTNLLNQIQGGKNEGRITVHARMARTESKLLPVWCAPDSAGIPLDSESNDLPLSSF